MILSKKHQKAQNRILNKTDNPESKIDNLLIFLLFFNETLLIKLLLDFSFLVYNQKLAAFLEKQTFRRSI